MVRPPDWQSRMASALAERRKASFVWGHHDCVAFASCIAEAICGIDFMSAFHGRYKTKIGAYRILKKYAGGGLEEGTVKLAAEFGLLEIVPRMAQRGDIVLAEIPIGAYEDNVTVDSIGVCLGERIAFAGPQGFVQIPIVKARRAWRVP